MKFGPAPLFYTENTHKLGEKEQNQTSPVVIATGNPISLHTEKNSEPEKKYLQFPQETRSPNAAAPFPFLFQLKSLSKLNSISSNRDFCGHS